MPSTLCIHTLTQSAHHRGMSAACLGGPWLPCSCITPVSLLQSPSQPAAAACSLHTAICHHCYAQGTRYGPLNADSRRTEIPSTSASPLGQRHRLMISVSLHLKGCFTREERHQVKWRQQQPAGASWPHTDLMHHAAAQGGMLSWQKLPAYSC